MNEDNFELPNIGDKFIWADIKVQVFEVDSEKVSFFEVGTDIPLTYPIRSFLRDAVKI